MSKYKPGKGWVQLNGPVYENQNGSRIHLLGLVRLNDGTFFNSDREFIPYLRIAGGNRKRGLMIWANSLEKS